MWKKNFSLTLVLLITIICSYTAVAEETGRIERTTVSGMNVILEKNKSEVAEITLLLKSGTGIEPENKKGTAYIMNNIVYWMLNDPKSKVGYVDVYTVPDYTIITLTTLSNDIVPALENIKYLLSEPFYDYDSVQDLKNYFSTRAKGLWALMKAYSNFNSIYYGANHPYNDAFTPETISAITGVDVYKWYRQTYQPGNAVLSISGNVDYDITKLKSFFTDMKTETVNRRLLIQPVNIDEDKTVVLKDPNGMAASICIGFSAPTIQDPDYPAFKIIEYYLSEYMHYFEELRLKNGLIYSDLIYYNGYEKPKAPTIIFANTTDPDSVRTLESKTLEILNKLKTEGIEEIELVKVIKAWKAENEAQESAEKGVSYRNALSFYLNTQLVYYDNLLPKLEQVKTEDIKKVANRYFQHYIEVIYNPTKIAEDIN